jgi:hypothetical protein
MLNLVQHLTKSMSYETLKQVQGDKSGLFTRPSILSCDAPRPCLPAGPEPSMVRGRQASRYDGTGTAGLH